MLPDSRSSMLCISPRAAATRTLAAARSRSSSPRSAERSRTASPICSETALTSGHYVTSEVDARVPPGGAAWPPTRPESPAPRNAGLAAPSRRRRPSACAGTMSIAGAAQLSHYFPKMPRPCDLSARPGRLSRPSGQQHETRGSPPVRRCDVPDSRSAGPPRPSRAARATRPLRVPRT
jgi:hypothetical protein